MIEPRKTIISEIEKELEGYEYSEVSKIIFDGVRYDYIVSRSEFDLVNVEDWQKVGYRGELYGEIPIYKHDIDEKYIIKFKKYAQYCDYCKNHMYFDQTLGSCYCPNCTDDTFPAKLKRKLFTFLS